MLLLRIFGCFSSLGLIWAYYNWGIGHPEAYWNYREIIWGIWGGSLSTTIILTGVAELILGLIVVTIPCLIPELISFFRSLMKKMKKQENLQRQQEGDKVDLRKGYMTFISSYHRSRNQQLIKSK